MDNTSFEGEEIFADTPRPTVKPDSHAAGAVAAPKQAQPTKPKSRFASVGRGQGATQMSDTTPAQQQAVQHPSKAQFDRLVAYVQELVADHNRLEARVDDLEGVLLGNGRKNRQSG
jgi:hypothetical protein